MAAKFSDLVAYFKTLAEKHVDIRHSATAKHFYRFELDEVLMGMCSNIKYPALILEGYDFNYNESSSDNVRKKRSGAFILLTKVKDLKNFDEVHDAWDSMEQLADDILIKMKNDKEAGLTPVLRDFNISECSGNPMSIEQMGQCGIRVTFNLTSAVNDIVDEDKWL